jgi:hypothetical protein
MIQWSQTEKTNKSAIQEHKLRVVYIAAEDGANGIPEENEDMEQSRIEESVSVSLNIWWIYIRFVHRSHCLIVFLPLHIIFTVYSLPLFIYCPLFSA